MVVFIDAVEVEFPSLRRPIERVFDRNAIADLPMETVREGRSYDSALAVLDKIVPLVVRDLHFRHNLALIFRIYDELWEKILFVLINAAKPIVVSNSFHALNAQYFVSIGERNRIDKTGTVDDYQAIRAGELGAAAERPLYDRKKGEQKQRYGERANRKNQPYFFAEEICKNQPGEFHATPPAMAFCGSLLPSTSTPFSRCSVVCARSATTGS